MTTCPLSFPPLFSLMQSFLTIILVVFIAQSYCSLGSCTSVCSSRSIRGMSLALCIELPHICHFFFFSSFSSWSCRASLSINCCFKHSVIPSCFHPFSPGTTFTSHSEDLRCLRFTLFLRILGSYGWWLQLVWFLPPWMVVISSN